MRIIEGLDALSRLELGCEPGALSAHSVVAVGVFDGMHLGHQRLIFDLLEMATRLQGEPTVITFRNHPDEVLSGRAPEPLISIPHRLRLLRRAGVRRVLLLTFDEDLRRMSADDFAATVLRDGLGAKGLLLGFDSALGRDREGTPARFAELGQTMGFVVQTGAPLQVDGHLVSSTAIRDAITGGDLDLAGRLLGRRPGAFGEVIPGDGRGRALGFPTANLAARGQVLPPGGVYAVEILWEGEQHEGVANLGTRPTFGDGATTEIAPPVLEIHFLDEDLDLYGSVLEITFVRRLRDERRFTSPDELRAQITRDILDARRVLGS
jgi:riboflavin kinase/FMN adenylyltransferase